MVSLIQDRLTKTSEVLTPRENLTQSKRKKGVWGYRIVATSILSFSRKTQLLTIKITIKKHENSSIYKRINNWNSQQ